MQNCLKKSLVSLVKIMCSCVSQLTFDWKAEYGVGQQIFGFVVLWEEGEGFLSDGPLGTCDPLGHFKPNLRRGSVSNSPNLSIPFGRWVKDRGFLHAWSAQITALCWAWQPHSWPGGRPNLQSVFPPWSHCLLPKCQDRKEQQGHGGEVSPQKAWEM